MVTTLELFEELTRYIQIDVSSPPLVQLVEFTRDDVKVRYVADGMWRASSVMTRMDGGDVQHSIDVLATSFDELVMKVYAEWQKLNS